MIADFARLQQYGAVLSPHIRLLQGCCSALSRRRCIRENIPIFSASSDITTRFGIGIGIGS